MTQLIMRGFETKLIYHACRDAAMEQQATIQVRVMLRPTFQKYWAHSRTKSLFYLFCVM
jgi:hypothetical protein